MEGFTTVILFIVVLSLLVAIHEFCHFWVARRCGVKVLRFSIGFGTPIFRYQPEKGGDGVPPICHPSWWLCQDGG
ncbi:MAG: site-2 protease family protein [Gammaproteobacteria bacterium]|nr:site-2 protease family protein [Gammaproteobacteria bacterium]